MTTRFGYACLNMTLGALKPRITCNRGMIRRTFDAKGIPYASELALQNVTDLISHIQWNHEHGIEVFRITSCLFPWASEYKLQDLPDYEQIVENLQKAGKLAKQYGQRLSTHPGQYNVLTSPREEVVQNCDPQIAAKWIIGELNALLNKNELSLADSKITSSNFAELISKISDGTISGKIAKDILEDIWKSGNAVNDIIDSKGLKQISDTGEIEKVIDGILENNKSQVEAYKSGKDKLFGFFVGQVMKATQGKANPGMVNQLLKDKLS